MNLLKARCKDCNRINVLDIDTVKEMNVICDGKDLTITYFDCTNCGEKHMVQLDDAISTSIFKNEKNRILMGMRNGKTKYKKDINSLLAQRRKLLNVMYSGRCYLDEKGNSIKIDIISVNEVK